ncbi:hypothetical protein POM88_042292 [Heracleum sosnowskyi]|uniref:HD-Zip IV C-terminal domain-containing protein n=1 Tax=Heracleum sosnowskyi TaxID=360622 RepID=A0AAD8HHN5_9APIA|nr:hypothetical protein POM88_042292 [Heracleum sosnowskyi]
MDRSGAWKKRLYSEKYKAVQHGFIGLDLYAYWYVPYTNSVEDVIATQRANDFFIGWFLNPLVYERRYEDELWKPSLRGIHPAWLLGYRLVVFIVLLIMLSLNVAVDGGSIFDYYTQWTFTLITLYFGLGAVISMHGCYKHHNKVGGDGMCNFYGDAEQGTHGASLSAANPNMSSSSRNFHKTEVGRQCERLASAMASNVPAGEVGVITTPEGRKSMLKLAERMVLSFCTGVGASTAHTWTTISGSGADDVRVMTRKSIDDPGRPPGIVLSAATSFWLPVPPKRVFDFLRDENSRSEWSSKSRKLICSRAELDEVRCETAGHIEQFL